MDRCRRSRGTAHVLQRGVGLRNHAAQIHGCNRRACGNRGNGKATYSRNSTDAATLDCGGVRRVSWSSTATPVATFPPEENWWSPQAADPGQTANWTLFAFTPPTGHEAKPSAGVHRNAARRGIRAKEINGVAVRGIFLAVWRSGRPALVSKVNALLLRTSKGGLNRRSPGSPPCC